MRVIELRTLNCYCEQHPMARGSLLAWHDMISKKRSVNHAELKHDFPGADHVGNSRFVSNIKGNKFRLITAINFQAEIVLVNWFGTHAAYDTIRTAAVHYENPCPEIRG